MRYLLKVLLRGSDAIRIGRYEFITYTEGGMAVRQQSSGLMSPEHRITMAGLRRCLAWIDEMEAEKNLQTD